MQYAWDEDKRRENLRRRGLDFADAAIVMQSLCLTALDTREDYGEDRWCSIGMLYGRVVVLVYSALAPDLIRVISLRKATRHERTHYARFLQDRLGAG
jgi:uncharacterized DUF497 family protein